MSYKKYFLLIAAVFLFFSAATYSEENLSANELDASAQLAMSAPDYPVTPGDIYQIAYNAGGAAVKYNLIVDSTYRVKIANLAVINVEGKNYIQLKRRVEEIVNRNYPMGGVQFAMFMPSIFTVVIKGEVHNTQIRRAWALTRLSSVIDGITGYASTRNISITSSGGETKTYDLFKAQRYGDLQQDPLLRPDDVITISRYSRKVELNGAVERAGSYELLENENLTELIEIYGGGLENKADTSRIELSRSYGNDRTSGRKIYLNQESITKNYELMNYDSVYIYSYYDSQSVIFFEGSIYEEQSETELVSSNKIAVPIKNNENYGFIIRNKRNIFSQSSDIKKAYIKRGETIIPLDVEKILHEIDYYPSETAEPYDVVVIPFKQFFINVAGAVKLPNRYPYIPDRNWEYYIGLAGGFDKSLNSKEAIFIKDRNGKVLTKDDIITPESTITAETNSFTHYFNIYAPIITTTLTIVSSIFTIIAVTQK